MSAEEITYGSPRFLAIVEMAFLREAMEGAFKTLERRREELAPSDRDGWGNYNATVQALRRSFFIGAYSLLEQNLDEVVSMAGKRLGKCLKPSDLRATGVKRSFTFAKKVLGAEIDLGKGPLHDVLDLQRLRNHLVHYGAGFRSSNEKRTREGFERIDGIALRPMICFEDHALDKFLELFVECVSILATSIPELPPQKPQDYELLGA